MKIEDKKDFMRFKGVEANIAGWVNDLGAVSDLFNPLDVSVFTDAIREGGNKLLSAEIWPVAFCNSHCNFCSSDINQLKDNSHLGFARLNNLIVELAELGVSFIRFSGGGEAFLEDHFTEIIK